MKDKKYGMCYGGAAVKQSGKAKGGGEMAGGHTGKQRYANKTSRPGKTYAKQ